MDSQKASGPNGGKILSGALYIVTVLLVLGFLWQSIVSLLLT